MTVFLKKHWPLVGLVLLLGAAGIYVVKAGKRLIQEPIVQEVLSGEGLKLKDIHYTQDDPDKGLKWVLDAKEVSLSEDGSSVLFQDFKLRLEPEDRAFVTLNGKRGDYSRDSGVIKLWGDLEAVSGEGYRVLTDHAQYDENAGLLSTDADVKIFGPFFTVSGRGLEVDLSRETLKILASVKTVVESGL